ncbi:hypothetical protein BpHYR1_035688 [Brachionus plicatilis]|uniref:Uncharacterized protein n=1 Tax=Brachionus plicatilis TaxID=10195 RepID=A0A3M7QLB9_BRAPC|nr:hypothetical protein BpHYR1_035688 [Brachionus plicatilis]
MCEVSSLAAPATSIPSFIFKSSFSFRYFIIDSIVCDAAMRVSHDELVTNGFNLSNSCPSSFG